jgi:NADP-dependent 3-hydroxy acid dehydrogenase YdfG
VSDAVRKVIPDSQVDTYPLDLSDSTAVDQFVKSLLDKHGHIDVLVNNAGMASSSHPLEGVIWPAFPFIVLWPQIEAWTMVC